MDVLNLKNDLHFFDVVEKPRRYPNDSNDDAI